MSLESSIMLLLLLVLIQLHFAVQDDIRTVEQCYGQPLPLACEPNLMVQVTKAIYRQTKNCGNFHSAFCSQEEDGNPACVGNQTCIFNTPYVYLSPECGYSNNFLVKYKCISSANHVDICNSKSMTNMTGFIVSPNYPIRYPTGKQCALKINLAPGYRINIYTLDLYLAYYRVNHQTDKQCIDNLIISDGSTKAESLCSGKQRSLVFTSSTNWVVLNFTSDWHQYRNSKGFWLYYEAIYVGTSATTPLASFATPSTTMKFKTLENHNFTPKPVAISHTTPKIQKTHVPLRVSKPKLYRHNYSRSLSQPTIDAILETLGVKIGKNPYAMYDKADYTTKKHTKVLTTIAPRLIIPKVKGLHVTVATNNTNTTEISVSSKDVGESSVTALPGKTLHLDGSHRKHVQEKTKSEIGAIIAGTSVCIGLVLLVIVTAVVCNRRINSKRISRKEKTSQFNEIIMAYGTQDQLLVPNSNSLPNLAYEHDSPRPTSASLPPPSPVTEKFENQQMDYEAEQMSPWPVLRPIDERPELLYTQVKKRSEENLKMINQLRGKHNPRKSKSLDDINRGLNPQRPTKRDRLQEVARNGRELGSITLSMSLDSIESDQESDSPVFNTDTRTGTLTRALYETLEDLYTESILARARSDYEAVQQGRLFSGEKTSK